MTVPTLRARCAACLILIVLLALLPGAAMAQVAAQPTPQPTPPATVATAVVAKVYYKDKADLDAIGATLDVWTVAAKEGYAVVLLEPEDYARLLQGGRRIEIDPELTEQVNTPPNTTASPDGGIPGYTCYRTVEETYSTMAALAAAHPNLLTWTDTGDSWDKVKAGGPAGYDLYTLVLTNKSIAGPKPKFYLMAAIHAREYATAELAARFVEKLVTDYGVEADATWLIDHYELHTVFQVNPDGRKLAEAGSLWRKNADNDDGCTDTRTSPTYHAYGVDLNRNSTFKWNTGGSSGDSCAETYRGPAAGSEPETQHIENYMANLFGDHRGPADTDAAPLDTEGVMVTLHSYADAVLYPWGWSSSQLAPNATQLATLGRKFGYYNNYEVCASGSCLYIASGGSDDYAYGALGIPGYTFEVGTAFFQPCSTFESDVLPRNLPALKYAFKAARRPYQDPAGPETYTVAVSSGTVARGTSVTLTAKADDNRYNSNGHDVEPSQPLVAARYTIDAPTWKGGLWRGMSATDGAFNTSYENVRATVDTTALAPGKHILFVEAQDANGQWGVPSAVFLTVTSPCSTPVSPSDVVETLSASRTDVTLTWTHLAVNDSYEVWQSATPYFTPGEVGSAKLADITLNDRTTLSFTDSGVVGDPNVNHYYVVRGANACGAVAAPSARSGEVDYGLVR